MSTLLASAASNRLEALARRLFAGLLVLSFLEAVSNQFAQREYFNMASDVALAAMAIAVAGVAVSAWGPKSRNNFWLWAYAGSSLSAILFLPIMNPDVVGQIKVDENKIYRLNFFNSIPKHDG